MPSMPFILGPATRMDVMLSFVHIGHIAGLGVTRQSHASGDVTAASNLLAQSLQPTMDGCRSGFNCCSRTLLLNR